MSVYTPTARFDGQQRALTEDELFKIAPSIFADAPHPSRSEKFRPIATIDVVRDLTKAGFAVVGAMATRVRSPDRVNYNKHLLRIRRLDGTQRAVGDTVFEMLLKNANDGTGPYDLMAGLFRIACLNSLVSALASLDAIRIRHTGKDVAQKVVDGTFRVMSAAEATLDAPVKWSQIQLDEVRQLEFATKAHELRFGDSETLVTPQQLLMPRRSQDVKKDLWSVFNVVQENVIKGGVQNRFRDDDGRAHRRTSRNVRGIDQSISLNRGLWQAAHAMAA